jgi:hypothetical protein
MAISANIRRGAAAVAKRGWNCLIWLTGFIKNIFGKGDGLRSPNPLRLSRPKSLRLNLNNENAESSNNTQLTPPSLTSTAAPSGVKTGSDTDARQYDARDIEPYKNKDAPDNDGTDSEAADPKDYSADSKVSQSGSKRTRVDMWAMADNQLRDDPQKSETMQKYDRLLEKKLPPGSKLEPIGTDERRKQAFEFFDSEIERLNAIDTTK